MRLKGHHLVWMFATALAVLFAMVATTTWLQNGPTDIVVGSAESILLIMGAAWVAAWWLRRQPESA